METDEDGEVLHILRSNERLGWVTGRTTAGKRVLAGRHGEHGFLIRFSSHGKLKEYMSFRGDPLKSIDIEKPIRVSEFEVPELGVGLYVLPREYRYFMENTHEFDVSERGRVAVLIQDWRESGHFIFHWDGEEYRCDEEGRVLSHKSDDAELA
jgi:hypothetical protein